MVMEIPFYNNYCIESLNFSGCMQLLGLEYCADTMVGDDMLRGISGGQKKRVTTGRMDSHYFTKELQV